MWIENEECMVESKTPGVTFVGVSKCKSIPPWQSTEPANGKWRWVTDPSTWKDSLRLSSPGGGVRHIAFHKGLILAGSFTSARLTTLTHWGRVTHIYVSKLTSIGSDNGLSPGRRQAIIWTNAGILLIGPVGINFSEILIRTQTFSFKKMHLKMSSAKWSQSVSASIC